MMGLLALAPGVLAIAGRTPLVGWVADRFGPRWALGVGAGAGFAAAIAGRFVLLRSSARSRRG